MERTTDEIFTELKQQYQNFRGNFQIDKRTEDKTDESGDNRKECNFLEDNNCNELIGKVEEALKELTVDHKDYLKMLIMKASLMYEKAKVQLGKHEIESCQELLQSTLDLIIEHADNPQVTFLYLRVVNHLSYVLSRTGNLQKACKILEDIIDYSPKGETLVYSTDDLFNENFTGVPQNKIKLNKLIVNNMQMLSWLYGKLGQFDLHTQMQHKSLQVQLNTHDCDVILWATRCCRLASLFLTKNKWVHARYHLAAAETVLNRQELQLAVNSELNKAQGELARAWVHYGLHLFCVSKRNILEQIYDPPEELQIQLESSDPKPETLTDSFKFTNLPVEVPNIPNRQISTTTEAREIFEHTQKWLKRSRLFYTLRDHPLQYVNSILDLSETYRFLAFYEPDVESQYNVQKKRYDALEALCTILKEVRPNCYLAVSVELLKELADVQIEMMGLNLKRLFVAQDVELTEEGIRDRIDAMTDIRTKICNLEEITTNTEAGLEIEPVASSNDSKDVEAGNSCSVNSQLI